MKRPVTFLLVASMLVSASALADGLSRNSAKKISQVVRADDRGNDNRRGNNHGGNNQGGNNRGGNNHGGNNHGGNDHRGNDHGGNSGRGNDHGGNSRPRQRPSRQ